MRGGDAVTYVDGAGAVCPATVCGIPDTGASGAKVLDLRMADGTAVERVVHEKDRLPGGPYWTLGVVAPEPSPALSRGRRHWQA